MSIKLTTIIPIYKEEKYIYECLDSVHSAIEKVKAFDDLHELIIVSDGADDNVIKNLHEYDKRFKNYKIIKSEHKGVATARNLGINEAKGKYITFIDADDRLCEDFFSKTIDLLDLDKGLFIFSIKRYEDDKIIDWKIEDKIYDSNSDFADEYIKTRRALIYPNWNKFYKTSIIHDNNIKFDESMEFGEDRLFNYEYLRHCETIVTSSIFKNEYIKRTDHSLSTKYFKNYFNLAIKLHKEKMKCFIDLSKNVSIDEIKNFVGYDITNEIDKTIARFDDNKQEEIENIGLINSLYLAKCLSYGEFGSKVKLDTWYKTEESKKIVYNEIRKNIYEDFDDYKKFIYS